MGMITPPRPTKEDNHIIADDDLVESVIAMVRRNKLNIIIFVAACLIILKKYL